MEIYAYWIGYKFYVQIKKGEHFFDLLHDPYHSAIFFLKIHRQQICNVVSKNILLSDNFL